MSDSIVPVVVPIAVSLLLYFLNRASKQSVNALKNGYYELRLNKMYQLVGMTGIVLGICILLIPLLAEEYSAEIFIVTGFLFLFIIGLSLPCFFMVQKSLSTF